MPSVAKFLFDTADNELSEGEFLYDILDLGKHAPCDSLVKPDDLSKVPFGPSMRSRSQNLSLKQGTEGGHIFPKRKKKLFTYICK